MANIAKVCVGVLKVVGGAVGVVVGIDEAGQLIEEGIEHISEGATEG
jgi:hypothetical protein